MNIIRTLSLSQKQMEDIRSLTSLCCQNDGIILSCPEDADEFWILYEVNAEGAMEYPAAFFAVYKTEPDLWECYAFTRPDRRRRGYFSTLCSSVCEDSREEGEPDLCFITDNRCGQTLEVLKHMEAEFLYDEYMMALEPGLADGDADGASVHGGCPDKCRELLLSIIPDNGLLTVTAWLNPSDAEDSPTGVPSPAGSCRLSIRGRDVYLYALEILPQLRGRGYGACFMDCIISMLKERGYRGLSLQVSGNNEPALGLYKKTGFRITETLSYYLY